MLRKTEINRNINNCFYYSLVKGFLLSSNTIKQKINSNSRRNCRNKKESYLYILYPNKDVIFYVQDASSCQNCLQVTRFVIDFGRNPVLQITKLLENGLGSGGESVCVDRMNDAAFMLNFSTYLPTNQPTNPTEYIDRSVVIILGIPEISLTSQK